MQHIVFEVHAYVIALSKTVLDYESLCSTLCLKCMLMLLLCQRLLDYESLCSTLCLKCMLMLLLCQRLC